MDPLGCVVSVLELTVALTNNDPWFNRVKLLAADNGALTQFKAILEKLVAKLDSSSKLKDLLWKFNKADVTEALTQIERLKSLVNLALANDLFSLTKSTKSDISVVTKELDEQRLGHDAEWLTRLSVWLDVPDPSSNYAAALKRRHEGTGIWLLEDQRFLEWKRNPGSSLWLHGIPGCGKTVLTANVISQLESISSPLAYFYSDFNDDDKRSIDKCIRSLTVQLASQVPEGIQQLRTLHQKCRDGQLQPQDTSLVPILYRLISQSKSTYIVLDALDECDDHDVLLDHMAKMIRDHQNCLHLLAASRRERILEERLQPLVTYDIHIKASSVDADINVYVEDLLKNDVRLRKWPAAVQTEIRMTMAAKAHGMFRWAYCQLESMRKCIKLSALRQMLSTLPKTLDETYERILSTIEKDGQLADAIRILQWLCFVKRPITLKALVDVLANDVDGNGLFLDEERLPDPLDIITICSSLVAFRDETSSFPEDCLIQLAHYSVQEYLLSDRSSISEHFSVPSGNALLAEVCLIYTLHVCSITVPTSTNLLVPLEGFLVTPDYWIEYRYPLCRYACELWYQHAADCTTDESSVRVSELAVQLFEDSRLLDQWLNFHDPNRFSWHRVQCHVIYHRSLRSQRKTTSKLEARSAELTSPVFYAAIIGMPRLVELLVSRGSDVNQSSYIYPPPLHAAVLKKDVATVKSILLSGGRVNQQHVEAGNPLQMAAASGDNVDLVRLLLDSGATLSHAASDFTFISSYTGSLTQVHGTALHAACYGGSVEVLNSLLELDKCRSVPVTNDSLFEAVDAGFQRSIIEEWADSSLRLRGALPTVAVSQDKLTTLHHVSFSRDYSEILRQLFSHGINADRCLRNAYDSNDARFFRLLLDAGASANAPDSDGDTLLHRALHDNRPELFSELLKHGADFMAFDYYGRICLDYAVAFPQGLQDFRISTKHCSSVSAEARDGVIHRTAFRNIEEVLNSDFAPEEAYHSLRNLGHCLIYLNRLRDAVTVFQMVIFSTTEPNQGLRHRAVCDGCNAHDLETTLWACRTCRDADLCDPCYHSYGKDLLRNIHLCQNHEFLEIPLLPFDMDYTHWPPRVTPKIEDFLLELRQTIPSSSSSEYDLADVPRRDESELA